MKAYTQELRERIAAAVDRGVPREEVADVFGVGLSTIKRYLKQRRETGSVAAKPIPGRPPKKLGPLREGLRQQLAAVPDATDGPAVSVVGAEPWPAGEPFDDVSDHQAAGLDTKKKTLGASERDEAARSRWRELMKQVDATKLVVVDESGSNIGLTPLYAWAPRGERAYGSIPRNRGKNTTLIASLSLSGVGAAMILEGSTNASAFEVYVEQVLAPSLAPGQIVVMDNLSAHKGQPVREAIAARGCQLLFLPSYSPDLSPIEEAFSKRKRLFAQSWGSHT